MVNFNFNPFPVITTKRLVLRRIIQEDENNLFTIRSDKRVMRYIARPIAKTIEDVRVVMQAIDGRLNENEGINWAITLKTDNKLIGTIGLFRPIKENHRCEVGYMLNPNFHSMGIMQEALEVVIEYGFEQMNLHSIFAVIDPENNASAKLLERNKFVKEAHFKEDCFWEGRYLDSVHYSLLKQNYIKIPAIVAER